MQAKTNMISKKTSANKKCPNCLLLPDLKEKSECAYFGNCGARIARRNIKKRLRNNESEGVTF
jgi:hypothetical protein